MTLVHDRFSIFLPVTFMCDMWMGYIRCVVRWLRIVVIPPSFLPFSFLELLTVVSSRNFAWMVGGRLGMWYRNGAG